MRIKELIKERGYTQKEFADKLGMSTVGLSQLLATEKPSYTTLEKFASTLGVEVWELLISREEITGLQKTKSPTIICPHCGKEITIKAE